MSRVEEVQDVVCFALPEGVGPEDVSTDELELQAARSILVQYEHGKRPHYFTVQKFEFLTTNDPAKIDEFQPAHDCAACLAGNDQARAYLREHPDRFIVLGNLAYREVWDE